MSLQEQELPVAEPVSASPASLLDAIMAQTRIEPESEGYNIAR